MGNTRLMARTRLLPAAAAVMAAAAGFRLSPWPAALLIRAVFYRGARRLAAVMRRYAPAAGVIPFRGLRFEAGSRSGTLDLFVPAEAVGPAPLVVWIHGGAWLSGSRNDVEPYLRLLAASGYAAAGLTYTVSPRGVYPRAVEELSAALTFLSEHGADFGVDTRRIVLAGDSAGAQLAAQLAVLATNPDYARRTGLSSPLKADRLRGVILHCGVYDVAALASLRGILGWGFKTALWAYSGQRDWSRTAAGREMSVLNDVGAGFPPAFITGGNGDSLTATQSVPLAARLTALNTDVRTRFWPPDHRPALPHEYQFHLDRTEAQQTLTDTLDFLQAVCGPGPAPSAADPES